MKKARPCVLVFYIKQNEKKVLLARKYDKSPIGAGMWNGYGGTIEKKETAKQTVIRETKEEAGPNLIVLETNLISRGFVTFYYHDNVPICAVQIFVCFDFQGIAVETIEMLEPTWFRYLEISSLNMLPGDKLFIPMILMGKSILNGYVIFNEKLNGIKSCSLPTC